MKKENYDEERKLHEEQMKHARKKVRNPHNREPTPQDIIDSKFDHKFLDKVDIVIFTDLSSIV
jgi:hypothetical protein